MGGRYVGIDLHRRRSVIYTMHADGEKVDCVRIANDALGLLEQVSRAGSDCEVVIEAPYVWYWAADLLRVPIARRSRRSARHVAVCAPVDTP